MIGYTDTAVKQGRLVLNTCVVCANKTVHTGVHELQLTRSDLGTRVCRLQFSLVPFSSVHLL